MRVTLVVGAVFLLILSLPAPTLSRDQDRGEIVSGFFQRHCIECHGEETRKAGLRLDQVTLQFSDETSLNQGIRLFDKVRNGEMPPRKGQALPEAERSTFLRAYGDSLEKADRAAVGRRRETVRRLNRVELEETLRDLLALPALRIKEDLPEDGRRFGLDKVAVGLDFSHIQISKLLAVTEKALRQAAASPPEEPKRIRWREPAAKQDSAGLAIRTINAVPLKGNELAEGYATKVEGDQVKDPSNCYKVGTFRGEPGSLAIFTGPLGAHQPQGIQPDHFKPTVPGWYMVRFSVWGLRWQRNAVRPSVRAKSRVVKTQDQPGPEPEGPEWNHVVRASLSGKPLEYFDAPSLKPTVHEFKVWLEPRQSVSFHALTLPAYGPPNWPSHDGPKSYEGPAVAFDWFEVEGPLLDGGPSESHRRLFGTGVEEVPELLRRFAERAFRRPVSLPDIESFAALVEALKKQGRSPKESLLEGYRAILCAPDFLFVGNEGTAEDRIASRLSYFLWNSAPDPVLVDLARKSRLSDLEALRGQVRRMLQDPRSDRFVEHFLDEWLEMRNIDFTSPDPKLYPHFDPWLRDSMLEETRATFREMIDRDLGIVALVSSNEIQINQRLAELYQIPGVSGARLRSVVVPEGNPRGGFLTQAGVLKVTANGTVTSPILRGVWISERLLGVPRLPPPPNIPAIEPDARGAPTIRQITEKHRSDPACAACHSKTDPPGFALENFDAIGAWRDRYSGGESGGKSKQGLPVDPSGVFEDGRSFSDVRELRRHLAADPDALARNLIRQLLIYGTGSGLRFSDRSEVEAILRRVAARKYGLRALIEEVTVSRLFKGAAEGDGR